MGTPTELAIHAALLVFGKNENIVQVNKNKVFRHVPQHVVKQGLKKKGITRCS